MQLKNNYKAHKGVFIVRGQPITEPHLDNIHYLLNTCEEGYVVLGSSFTAPRWDHVPFREFIREQMILASLTDAEKKRIKFIYQKDYGNMTTWANKLMDKVRNLAGDNDATVALVGCSKDQPTGFYLQQFPDWMSISTPLTRGGMSATTWRDRYISEERFDTFAYESQGFLPAGTIAILQDFRRTRDFDELLKEKQFMTEYLKRFYDPVEIARAKQEGRQPHCAPYPPSFYTADAPVIQGTKQLMVQRAEYPGKGLWAHAGGHCEGQNSLDAAIKELIEETGLKVPEAVLRGSIVGSKLYDDPNRSTRKRTVTNAHFIHLTPQVKPGDDPKKVLALPKVRPSKESLKVEWRDLDMPREEYFEDHWKMSDDALALIKR